MEVTLWRITTTTTPIFTELTFARQRFANNSNTEFETDPKNISAAHTTLRTDNGGVDAVCTKVS